MGWRQQLRSGRSSWMVYGSLALFLGLVNMGQAQAQNSTLAVECDALAETINQNLAFMIAFETEILAFSHSASQAETLDDITAAADQYITAVDGVVANLDGLVVELGNVSILDADLADYRDDYATVVAGFADVLEIAGDAMVIVANTESETELPDNIEASQQRTLSALDQIQELTDQEAEVIAGVNAHCGYIP